VNGPNTSGGGEKRDVDLVASLKTWLMSKKQKGNIYHGSSNRGQGDLPLVENPIPKKKRIRVMGIKTEIL